MDLFLYGTLRDADLREAVAGAGAATEPVPATVEGYRLRPLMGSVVPLIEPGEGARCEGLLWPDLSDVQAERIALYEGAFGYTLVEVQVTVGGLSRSARMWLPPEEAEAGEGDWSLSHWQAEYGPAAVWAAEELFATTPRPAAEDLRAQFPMMQRRAWNRLQATRRAAPADLRHAAAPGDAVSLNRAQPAGNFFRLQAFEVTHRGFDGTTQGPHPREVLVGTDAVLVLPYDPARDRVVLVEQVRMGALEHGAPNPWTLEPVAGMIDAFEAPETAALRETSEEAGLDVTLVRAMAGYASPGNATDYFHCFAGLCDLPESDSRWRGGLAEEHEDLRLHAIPLDRALALVDSGEITALPCIGLLNWCARNRDRLRLEFAAREVR
ncbi:NUDIX domain-containing protein [Salipiger sp. IMCC34102]|uniref:NUDIX domain-containing protein n=1 Tax=Salipiger sp. IMCC34102 TaxID=2510647 RepID=UPI00101D1377|nr:NUDIX domain-containing protein [Salipiger sp. IMCC34102]RYH03288.1 NUDIX domain-containing protein [Salipiger sp. IMCC34102]